MESLDEIYNDLIMEHSMNSSNKKELDKCDYCEMGHNPNCGDEIKIQVKLNGDIIEDMAFTGHGCAISQSSTSIMIDTLRGKTITQAKEIIKTFINMIKRETKSEEELIKIIKEKFDLTPRGIINYLDLQRPIYRQTTNYGHFGKKDLPWEKIINF